jgi:hypothetical protein
MAWPYSALSLWLVECHTHIHCKTCMAMCALCDQRPAPQYPAHHMLHCLPLLPAPPFLSSPDSTTQLAQHLLCSSDLLYYDGNTHNVWARTTFELTPQYRAALKECRKAWSARMETLKVGEGVGVAQTQAGGREGVRLWVGWAAS